MSNIKYIRLVTGEDIISEVLEVDSEPHITVYNPTKIIYTFDGESRIRMQLMEWVFTNLVKSSNFALQRRDILIMQDASDSISKAYTEQVTETSEDASKLLDDLLSSRSRNTLD